jgi:hypothetical protein
MSTGKEARTSFSTFDDALDIVEGFESVQKDNHIQRLLAAENARAEGRPVVVEAFDPPCSAFVFSASSGMVFTRRGLKKLKTLRVKTREEREAEIDEALDRKLKARIAVVRRLGRRR